MHQWSQKLENWKTSMQFGLLDGRPYSNACINTYTHYVAKFLEEYQEITIETFKKALLAIPVGSFAKRLKLYEALRCFVRFLLEEGFEKDLPETDFLQAVKKYKPRRHLPPKKITVDQVGLEKLLEVSTSPLDKFIVIFLSQTGLRVTEAASLELQDIDLERRVLTVRLAKWGKSRRVGLTQEAIAAIADYLAIRPKSSDAHLFLNRQGKPIDRYGFRIRLEKVGRLAGVAVSPHALRRAFVTLNANKGRPLVMLQMACGHSDIATTRSYCLTSEDEAIQAMQTW